MFKLLLSTFFTFCLVQVTWSQKIEGYVYTDNSKQYLSEAKVFIINGKDTTTTLTDINGLFTASVIANTSYQVSVEKPGFYKSSKSINTTSETNTEYLKFPLTQKPGYVFEATIAEELIVPKEGEVVEEKSEALKDVKLEIYNITADSLEKDLVLGEKHVFSHMLIPGHQYLMLLRKEGYFAKEIIANVDVEGCILCIDGVGSLNPGVADNLTNQNTSGTLIANIGMKKILIDEIIKIDNIYYDLGKDNIRPDAAKELNKIVNLMKQTPDIVIELASHTDARGNDSDNMSLSQRRAENAIKYLTKNGVDRIRVIGKGYGESFIINKCTNQSTDCIEAEHAVNRRTEFKVVGFTREKQHMKSLKEMIEEKKFEMMINDVTNGKIVEIKKVKSDSNASDLPPLEKVENPIPGFEGVYQVPADYKPVNKDTVSILPTSPVETVVEVIDDVQISEVSDNPHAYKKELLMEAPISIIAISNDYNGYAIELMKTKEFLPEGSLIYNKFQGLSVDRDKDGFISYLLSGFTNENDANEMSTNLISEYPTLKILEYTNGLRK